MKKRDFKPFGQVSALTLGGGGIGGSWGPTDRTEAVATVNLALEMGIDHLDVAPMYGNGEAEQVIGEALRDKVGSNIRVTTKCFLGDIPKEKVFEQLEASLAQSMKRIGIEKVDLFLLHSQLVSDGTRTIFRLNEFRDKITTPLSSYFDSVIPSFERLRKEGKIGNWGITGIGEPAALLEAISHEVAPGAVQGVVNILNSIGGLNFVVDDFDPKVILSACKSRGVPVLAIRAVQAGALAESLDRDLHDADPDKIDYERACLFRDLAAEWSVSPAVLAHRYALSVAGVSSVILGAKNRSELQECLQAEQLGPLESGELEVLESLYI